MSDTVWEKKLPRDFETWNFSGFYEQNARRRPGIGVIGRESEAGETGTVYEDPGIEAKNNQWRRILLLVVAITVRNYGCWWRADAP